MDSIDAPHYGTTTVIAKQSKAMNAGFSQDEEDTWWERDMFILKNAKNMMSEMEKSPLK